MKLSFSKYAPVLFIVGGASFTVVALALIKIVYPVQSEYLPYQPACMLIGFGTAYWFGRKNASEIPVIAYPLWGLIFAGLSGFLGMQYLTLWSYIPQPDTYTKASPWGVMNFVLLVAQSFAIGGLSAEWAALAKLKKSSTVRIADAVISLVKPSPRFLSKDERVAIWTGLFGVLAAIAAAVATTLLK